MGSREWGVGSWELGVGSWEWGVGSRLLDIVEPRFGIGRGAGADLCSGPACILYSIRVRYSVFDYTGQLCTAVR